MNARAALNRSVVAVVVVAAALLLAACGGDDGAESGADSANPVDRAFATEMIPHHEGAVEMARIAQRRGESAFVKKLAADIVRTQTAEIDLLRAAEQRLAGDGVQVGELGLTQSEMGMDHDAGALDDADPFDERFVAMMIPHHEGAVRMSEVELERGGDPELRRLAERIIVDQRREIAAMRENVGGGGGDDGDGQDGGEHGAGHSG